MNAEMSNIFSNIWRLANNDWLGQDAKSSKAKKLSGKSLSYEPLEPRIALSAAGLVDVGTQPDGSLSGKIVYTHGGHGITADNLGSGSWGFQRPLLLNMIEDLGNQDQMTFFSEYLFRAGATVVPLRPVGHQPNEIILDNDDVEVTFSGSWSNSGSSIYFGDPGDVPYRYSSTSATETATAEYRPNVSEAGFYPVYSWTRYGSDRAAEQLYRINHSGGSTEVTVNHRRVGNGLVYLGTYHFESGTEGSVEISNRSSEGGKVVIADMIRFGNGVGDIDRGGGISGRDRTDEAGLYWVQWHVEHSQGVSTSEYRSSSADSSATVSLSPRYSEYMNREADGSLSDRVFVSFHSNASSGSARGAVGLHNTSSGGSTPNQLFLADTLGREVNQDLQAIGSPPLEHAWSTRTSHTYQASFNYGEINNAYIGGEFDATIVETAFHDNSQDAELMRDADVRDAIARATYQGVIKYFNNVDGGVTPLIMLPGTPTDVYSETIGANSVTVSWTPPVANSYNGDAATGYMVYGSTNGYGFDGGQYVAGGATDSLTLTGLDSSETYFFKVVAVNAGGESPASEIVAAVPNAGDKDILIVNGFDRVSRQLNPVQSGAERVRPRESNSHDYSVQVAAAIHANVPNLVVDTTSNEALIAGDVDLSDYKAVVWILGEESSADDTFNSTEQTLVTNYLAGGGKILASGAEIGWDLDNLNNGRTFYNNQLKADYLSDDAGTYNVTGAAGSIFAGLSFAFDDGSIYYDAQYPDRINPLGGATTALTYVGGLGGGAAIQYDGGNTKVVNFGFPFETITTEGSRNDVMDRVLEFFEIGDPTADFNQDSVVDGFDFLAWQQNFGKSSGAVLAEGDSNADGAVDGDDFQTWESQFGQVAPAVIEAVAAATSAPSAQPNTATPETIDRSAIAQRAFGFNGLFTDKWESKKAEKVAEIRPFRLHPSQISSEKLPFAISEAREALSDSHSRSRIGRLVDLPEEVVDRVFSDLLQGL